MQKQQQQATRSTLAAFRSRFAVIDEILDEAIERLKGASETEKTTAIKYFVSQWELTAIERADVIHFLVAQWEIEDAKLRATVDVHFQENDIKRLKLKGAF
jgi:hypothetical protein